MKIKKTEKREGKPSFTILKKFFDVISNNKIIASILAAIIGLCGYFLEPLKGMVHSKIWPNEISISHVDVPSETCSGCKIQFRINILQLSTSEIEKGILNFELPDGFQMKDNNLTMEIPQFKGMHTSSPVSISIPSSFSGTSTIKVRYENRQIKKYLDIKLNVTPQKNCEGPKIVTTDTNRVDLTGEWNIDLGADHGSMKIEQKNNNKVHGTYYFGDLNKGFVRGYKDGTVLNVFFEKMENASKKIRIESYFEINKNDKGYIEIKGCAYGIEKNETIKSDTESSQYGNCTKFKNYTGWKGISISDFYATSMISNCYN